LTTFALPEAIIRSPAVEVCVKHLEPTLQVSTLIIESPSIVRLQLDIDGAVGSGYAWTLDETEAMHLQHVLLEFLRGLDGQCIATHELMLAIVRAMPDELECRRAQTLIESALIDAHLIATDRTLCEALASHPRPIRVYGSDLYDSQDVEEITQIARSYKQSGFSGIKMRLGRTDLEWAKQRVMAVREAIGPDTALMVDAVQGWDLEFCERVMPILEAARLTWLEDPLRFGDNRSLAVLTSWSPIPVCTGESCRHTEQVDALIEAGAPIVMLDIQHLGGLIPTLEVIKRVAAAGRRLTFHVFPDLAVSLGAGTGVEWVEWAPLWGDCVPTPHPVDGHLLAAAMPGLGIWKSW